MTKKQTFLIVTALILCVCTMQAQKTSLFVHSGADAPQSFALSDISKITFSGGKLNVLPKSGAGSDFNLSAITKLTFSKTGPNEIISPLAVSTLKLYPNPVRDELYVTSDAEIESITVYGLQGNVLLRSNVQSSSATLSLGFLSKGIYVIQIKHADAVSTHKIIKL